MDKDKIQKLNDDMLDDVNGGVSSLRNTVYIAGSDIAGAGYAVMGEDITGDPRFLGGNGTGTPAKTEGPGNSVGAGNRGIVKRGNMPTWT